MAKAPDRGSFPLDHFHECDQEAKKYSECVAKHQLMPKRCREFQMKYLQCRMGSGLMQPEQMTKLGFVEENSWETEEAEKRFLFESIRKMKKQAWQSAYEHEKQKRKNEQTSYKPPTNLPQ